MKYKNISHQFVRTIPDSIEEGVVYISMPFSTAVHKCFCGCGNEVVTPLGSTDWRLTRDGNSITLDPSIGNWSFHCKSHYWIIKNQVRPARRWNQEEINAVRKIERTEKDEYFNTKDNSKDKGFLNKLKHWFGF